MVCAATSGTCTAHRLRKAGATIAAENGATDRASSWRFSIGRNAGHFSMRVLKRGIEGHMVVLKTVVRTAEPIMGVEVRGQRAADLSILQFIIGILELGDILRHGVDLSG
jgi:hypothetical protein